MKRTTYIIGGILLGSWLLVVVFIGLTPVLFPREEEKVLGFGEQLDASCPLPEGKVIKIEYLEDGSLNLRGGNEVQVVPATDGKPAVSYPKDFGRYLSVKQDGDTVRVLIDLPDVEERIYLPPLSMSVSQVEMIDFKAWGWGMRLKHLQADSLALDARAVLDSCRIGQLRLVRGSFDLLQSTVDGLHVDLDHVDRWAIDSCHIRTEYLYGNRSHYCQLEKGEAEELRWIPLSEEAELQVTLNGPASIRTTDLPDGE